MSELVEALKKRIAALADAKVELLAQIEDLDAKMESYQDLLKLESGEEVSLSTPVKRKPGRPKKVVAQEPSKSKPTNLTPEAEELFREAQAALLSRGGGTDPEQAQKIAKRFAPTARPDRNYGANVHTLIRGEMKRKKRGIPEPFAPETEETE